MKLSHLAAAALIGAGLAGPVLAHAHLDSASPADGAVLTAAPEAVTLVFTEDLELALSRLSVTGADGAAVETTPLEHESGDVRTLHVTLPTLAPGVYTVDWGVTSVDTHSTEGSYTFTLD